MEPVSSDCYKAHTNLDEYFVNVHICLDCHRLDKNLWKRNITVYFNVENLYSSCLLQCFDNVLFVYCKKIFKNNFKSNSIELAEEVEDFVWNVADYDFELFKPNWMLNTSDHLSDVDYLDEDAIDVQ